MGQEHLKTKKVIIDSLKLLGTPLCKAIETNISKDMIIKQGLSFTNECAGQKSSEYFCSQKIFSHQSPLPVWLLSGPTGGSRILSNVGSIKMYLASQL